MTPVLQKLLAHGASIESKQEDGATALLIASGSGHLAVVEVSYPFKHTTNSIFYDHWIL